MSSDSETDQYSITEVSSMLQIPQHVLRMWETQFTSISPIRGRNGRRAYNSDTIEAIHVVQNLLHEQGLPLAEAKAQLEHNTQKNTNADQAHTHNQMGTNNQDIDIPVMLAEESIAQNPIPETFIAQLGLVLNALERAQSALSNK